LWNTLRGFDESLVLMQHMAEHLRQEGHDTATAALFMQSAQEAQQRAEVMQRLVTQRSARSPATAQEEVPRGDDKDTGL
jgi:hypothetical protein